MASSCSSFGFSSAAVLKLQETYFRVEMENDFEKGDTWLSVHRELVLPVRQHGRRNHDECRRRGFQ